MTITRYSILATILWSSLFCIICFLGRRSIFFIQHFGIRGLLILFASCLFRLLFPIELAVVKVINIPTILNPINDFFFTPQKDGIIIIHICVLIWVAISIVLLLRFVILYLVFFRKFSTMKCSTTEQVERVAKEVVSPKDSDKITIIISHIVSVPMVCGFQKAMIILPAMGYSHQELHFIINHEYTHWKNRDAYVRLLVALFCAIFWWNPFVYLLKFDMDNILEMKCDRGVIAGKEKAEVISYGETLLKFATGFDANKAPFVTSEFANDKAIKQRFHLLFQMPISHNRQNILAVFVSVILFGALFISYLFSFQSQYVPKESMMPNETMTFAENPDGTYIATFKDGNTFVVSEITKEDMEADLALHK